MAKAMRNKVRKEAKLLETRTKLVEAALEAGHFTRRAISKATDIKPTDLVNLFTHNRDLYAKYRVMKKSLADVAADNIQDIINDPNHPHHFQASKFILQNYKSELDDELEGVGGELQVEIPAVGGESTASPILIKFSGSPKQG